MKSRFGFVSNSSTSSFTCEACGEIEAGFDGGMGDFYMFECENHHEIHEDCAKAYLSDEEKEEFREAISGDRYEMPKKFCPVCTLKAINDDIRLMTLMHEFNWTPEQIDKLIREHYESYDALCNAIQAKEDMIKKATE
jgi:hypothetical protein